MTHLFNKDMKKEKSGGITPFYECSCTEYCMNSCGVSCKSSCDGTCKGECGGEIGTRTITPLFK